MALEVRRIVTGHDSQGKAVVATDERLAGTGAAGRTGISRVDVWSTEWCEPRRSLIRRKASLMS